MWQSLFFIPDPGGGGWLCVPDLETWTYYCTHEWTCVVAANASSNRIGQCPSFLSRCDLPTSECRMKLYLIVRWWMSVDCLVTNNIHISLELWPINRVSYSTIFVWGDRIDIKKRLRKGPTKQRWFEWVLNEKYAPRTMIECWGLFFKSIVQRVRCRVPTLYVSCVHRVERLRDVRCRKTSRILSNNNADIDNWI